MRHLWILIFGLTALCYVKPFSVLPSRTFTCSSEFPEALRFFERENELMRLRKQKENLAAFKFSTDLTEQNRQAMTEVTVQNAKENKELAESIKKIFKYDQITDPCLKRQARIMSDIGFDVLDKEDFLNLKNAISTMHLNYASTKVCAFENPNICSLALEPHIQEKLVVSRDPEELAHYWTEWHDKAGTPMRKQFTRYVELTRTAAKLNNYNSYAEYWEHFYEDPDFEKNVHAVYKAILPLYQQIHGYVRFRLFQHYGPDVMAIKGNIPIHLLGNMWGQQWDSVMDLFTPYPNIPSINVTAEMKRQGYTVKKMFQLGDEFFQSMGMRALPSSFWELSMLQKPEKRSAICHASAWDLYGNSDVRIKMCTEVNAHYLNIVHHELGHIQYYLQYEHMPTPFRGAPNPGFHEAVGDVIALSVGTAKHLHAIGLSNIDKLNDQTRINELFRMALKKVVFLPFAYAMDKFRYAVFRDELREEYWNVNFWQIRSVLSGLEPPIERTERDFDPPAKYHISADVEYLRYFAAHIFQFQFHKAMCLKTGEYVQDDPEKPLDNCDIYRSEEAGNAFSDFLSSGNSRPWKEILEEFTGDTEMNPSALLEYFEPLHKWLVAENRKLGAPIGWDVTDKVYVP
uniref:Angiotensin-converting enzyme n=1 Tax=Glossina brevipalpis TaxID=37001 RepID=A0A1A9WU14_9MUSC